LLILAEPYTLFAATLGSMFLNMRRSAPTRTWCSGC